MQLSDAIDPILDRIFDRDDAAVRLTQFVQQRIERRGFPASGRAANHESAGYVFRPVLDLRLRIGIHPETTDPLNLLLHVQDTDGQLLAEDTRRVRGANIEGLTVDNDLPTRTGRP